MNIRFIIILSGLIFLSELSFAQDWSLAKDKNGIKVYTRKIDGWGIKEYKVTATIKTSLSKMLATLKDVPARVHWVNSILEARAFPQSDNNVVWMYNRIDAPWPVSDRDNIIQFTFSYPTAKTARIDMKVIKEHKKAPIYKGIVRITKLEGHWTFKDKGNGYIEVKEQVVANPGGSIPDWVANWGVVDVPYKSMYNLKNYIEGK